jgi:sugar diacid utilization regulator
MLCWAGIAFSTSSSAAQKGNNNSAQEKKDAARIQAAKKDLNEAQKKMQNALKDVREAEAGAKKSFEAIATAKKSMDETTGRLERWISQNLGIPEAIESQRSLQAAYDEATKPLIAAMKTNPKYMPLVERASKAEALLKSLASNTELDSATRKQQQAAAAKEMADLRATVTTYLDSLSELKYPKEKLVAAQSKLAELRLQLKKQLEAHPDVLAARKKWEKAKDDHDKDAQKFASAKRKAAADDSKIAAERAQVAKANMLDKKNDANNNKNKKKNNNKKN